MKFKTTINEKGKVVVNVEREEKIMKKLTKEKIKSIVIEILVELQKEGLAGDLCIYFNNKRVETDSDGGIEKVLEEVNPKEYLAYAPSEHLISMSFEGDLYDRLNYGEGDFPESLETLFEKEGIYYELGESWNLSFYPSNRELEVEYTIYSEPPKPTHIYFGMEGVPEPLQNIMEAWHTLSLLTGDKGCCVIGAYMHFEYEGVLYEMTPPSPYQGEGSWTPHISLIKSILEDIGATNVYYKAGFMD